MDPQVVSSTGFVFDPTSKYRKPGRFYGTKYRQKSYFTMYPDYSKMKINKRNKKFFSPYNPVKKGEWKGYYNSFAAEKGKWKKEESNETMVSKIYIEEIKKLDEENENSRKLLEEKLLSSESSSAVQEKERLKEEIDKIKEEINEKNIRKNKIITDLQIHRLEEGYGNCGTEKAKHNLCTPGNADYILHTYVIQCINRLK